mgnify:CR=1 FL=1
MTGPSTRWRGTSTSRRARRRLRLWHTRRLTAFRRKDRDTHSSASSRLRTSFLPSKEPSADPRRQQRGHVHLVRSPVLVAPRRRTGALPDASCSECRFAIHLHNHPSFKKLSNKGSPATAKTFLAARLWDELGEAGVLFRPGELFAVPTPEERVSLGENVIYLRAAYSYNSVSRTPRR